MGLLRWELESEKKMGDRGQREDETQQDDGMCKRLKAESEGQLSNDEIEDIVKLFYQVYAPFSFVGMTVEQAKNKLCEMLMPYLTLIWHGGPVCTCLRRHYFVGNRIGKRSA